MISAEIPGAILYQLLHRTASAVVEAQRFLAPQAVMLVRRGYEKSDDHV